MAFLFTDETKEGLPRPQTLQPQNNTEGGGWVGGGAAFTGRKRDGGETLAGKNTSEAGGGYAALRAPPVMRRT